MSESDKVNLSKSKTTEKKSGLWGKLSKKAKIVMIIVLVALLTVLIITLVLSVMKGTGMRKSEKLAKKLGEPVSKASSYADVELKPADKYGFLEGNDLHYSTIDKWNEWQTQYMAELVDSDSVFVKDD
ncbi:MAG: hypothetical protein IKK88_05005, partial [Oscillospiraceae bacterium]|nr:hypothetical protein [Oscillospiraceae bacterium]